jgi:hypothetical protein
MDVYPGTTCIPSSSVIDASGNVNSNALKMWVDGLLSKQAPALDTKDLTAAVATPANGKTNPAQDYASQSATLRTTIQAEYCFYYTRYQWALTSVLNNATSSGSVVSDELKSNTQILNNKLNTILLVMKAIVNSRMNTLNTYYSGRDSVNSLNDNLDSIRQQLVAHSQQLQSNELESDIQSAMIDYSIEKNSSSRNMLAIYGFMNIVAAGLLYYLYKNSK